MNLRFTALAILVATSMVASAQVPDVKVHLDALLSYRQTRNGATSVRYYSLLGRHSTAALQFQLEPGFTGFLSERLERIPNDPDSDLTDEAYIEDEGIWRVGKQYLPFGTGRILRESAPAARADTDLILEAVPIRFAIVDAGVGRQRGAVIRIGSNPGASLALGEHFGINGTALTLIRRPEESPGRGRGWRRAFGFDGTLKFAGIDLTAEAVILRNPHRYDDKDLAVFDVSTRYSPNPFTELTLGYTRETREGLDFFRAIAEVEATENVALRPFFRLRSGKLWDFGFEVRVRL